MENMKIRQHVLQMVWKQNPPIVIENKLIWHIRGTPIL